MTRVSNIPGAAALIGKGIYDAMPTELAQPVGDGHAVVIGESTRHVALGRQLRALGWSGTVVNARATELACAIGVDHLEAVVLRRISTGRLAACNVSALFIL